MSKINKNIIFGIAGFSLTQEETDFFNKVKPLGFILFKRNIESKRQVKDLTASLRKITKDKNTPILIDQEGGRVARLIPPIWPKFCSMQELIKNNPGDPKKAIKNNGYELGKILYELGINVNCAPVCDLLIEDAHDIIGDRSFGCDPSIVADYARAMAVGLLEAKVTPIIKHIPGHGRAKVDSHEKLPVVEEDLETLEASDFAVFKKIADLTPCFAMTAHIIYKALDDKNPATLSKKVINYIRNNIGFKQAIMSDDLSMKALSGDLVDLTYRAFDAGCDIALHCNGKLDEMQKVAEGLDKFKKNTH